MVADLHRGKTARQIINQMLGIRRAKYRPVNMYAKLKCNAFLLLFKYFKLPPRPGSTLLQYF